MSHYLNVDDLTEYESWPLPILKYQHRVSNISNTHCSSPSMGAVPMALTRKSAMLLLEAAIYVHISWIQVPQGMPNIQLVR